MPSVPTEARAAVRRFKAELTCSATKLEEQVFDSAPFRRALEGFTYKRTEVGRQRAVKAIRKMAPGLHLESVGRQLSVWSYLKTSGPVIATPKDPGQDQPGVTLNYFVGGADPDQHHLIAASGLWTLEIPDHALGRLVQRSPNVDIRKALYQAHYAVLAARMMWPLPNSTRSLYIPSSDGIFAGHLISGRIVDKVNNGDLLLYFRARTWYHEDQLYDDDDRRPVESGSPSFGESIFLPGPLRTIKRIGKEIEVTPRERLVPL